MLEKIKHELDTFKKVSKTKRGKNDLLIVKITLICVIYALLTTALDVNAYEFGNTLTSAIETMEEHKRPFIIKDVLKGDYNDYQRYWMNYAWRKWHDKEFMVMLKAENGLLNHDRQSLVKDKNGREPSYGFCQIHKGYHPQIVNDPRFFTDPAWQLGECYRLWKGGTKFYGYINRTQREKARKHFNFN